MFKLIKSIIFLGILVVIFLAGKNYVAKYAIEKGVKSGTGLDLQLNKCAVGIKETSLGLEGIKLKNPAGFSDKYMFEAPEIYVNYTILPIFKKQIHLQELRLNLDSLVIVKNEKGELNLKALIPTSKKDKSEQPSPAPDKKESKPGQAFELKIDNLLLKINKIVYKDYSRGGEPQIKEYNLGVYETFKDIEGTQQLTAKVVQRLLVKTALTNIIDLNMDAITNTAKDFVLKSFGDNIKSLSEKTAPAK